MYRYFKISRSMGFLFIFLIFFLVVYGCRPKNEDFFKTFGSSETIIEPEDILPVGVHPLLISNPEQPFYLAGTYSQAEYSSNTYSKRQNEVSFGNLTGNFITAVAGAEGYQILDLATGEILSEETGLDDSGPFFGIAGATQNPSGGNSPAMILGAGENGFVLDRLDQAGPMEFAGTTFDAFPAGGNPITNVVPFVLPISGVGFFVYDASQNQYVQAEVGYPVSLFENKILVSAYMHDDILSNDPIPRPLGPILVLTQETESGVYLAKPDGTLVRAIDNIGFDARRIRCIEDGTGTGNLICAVSVFGHNRLGLLTWDGQNQPVLTDFADIGDGPVGIDLRLLSNGNIRVVSAGYNDNTITETEVGVNGRVISTNTRSVMQSCLNPGHVVYIQDAESMKILGTCYTSNNYFIVESEM